MNLIFDILRSWLHGFKTKSGSELWLKRQGNYENSHYPADSQRRLK